MPGSLFGDDNERPRTLFIRNHKGEFVAQSVTPLDFRSRLESIAKSHDGRTTHISMMRQFAALVEDPRSLAVVKNNDYMRDSLIHFMRAVIETEREKLSQSWK